MKNMYNWLFYKIYTFYIHKNNHDPVFNTSILICFAQIIHSTVFLLLLSKLFSFEMPFFSHNSSINKLFLMPIMGLWLIIVYLFYRNKIKKYNFDSNSKPLKLVQLILIIFLIVFIPLYIGIRLSGNQLWK